MPKGITKSRTLQKISEKGVFIASPRTRKMILRLYLFLKYGLINLTQTINMKLAIKNIAPNPIANLIWKKTFKIDRIIEIIKCVTK